MRSISSALDATIAELDRLQQTTRAPRAKALEELTAYVSRLDEVRPGAPDEPLFPDRRPADRPAAPRRQPDPAPVLEQPRGWPNAIVREKIVDEALRTGRW